MPKRNVIWILVAGIIALLLWKVPEGLVRRDALYNQFAPLLDVRVQVRKHYVEEIDDQSLMRGAIDGMLMRLDPYSAYFDAREYDQFSKRTRGQFYGIGIEVMRLPGEGLLVVSPIEGSPAFQAGIQAGDRITMIDSRDTEALSLEESVDLISGTPGTAVHLTIYRPTTEETFDETITRGLITVQRVRGWARLGEGHWDYLIDPQERIGYVRISGFEGQTAEQFDAIMRELIARHAIRGLVLDVRDNPGGLLPEVVEIADLFVDKGKIVSTRPRFGPEQPFMARPGKYPDFPIVVLINRGSASASEILAGCLRDHGRAMLVGERSFGKGSVQELIPLENGRGAVKLTTAYYYMPNGERIHGRGVTPHKIVDLTPAERTDLLKMQVAVYSPATRASASHPATQPAESHPATTSVAPVGTQPASNGPTHVGPAIDPARDRQLTEALHMLRAQAATRPG